ADDPGKQIGYYDYPATLRGLAFQLPEYVNDPKANRSWSTIQFAGSKRLSNHWQFAASYSATKINDPLIYNQGGSLDFGINTLDPNSEINSANRTWEWLAKASGGYQFPWDLLASANFEHRSGDPSARTVQVRGGVQIPNLVIRAEP